GGSPGAVTKIGTNFALGSNAAGRLAAYYNRMGGFMDAVQPDFSVKHNLNTSDRTGARLSFLWTPTAHLKLTPRFVHQSVKADGWDRRHVPRRSAKSRT